MMIAITGARFTPGWETLQQVIREVVGEEAPDGLLTRIRRVDGQCNYRAPGLYDVEYVPLRGDVIKIVLDVKETL